MVVLVVTEVVLTVLWVVVTVVAELAVVVEMLLMLLVEVKLVTVLWVCVMLLLVLEVAVTVSELVALTVTEVVVAVLVVAVAVCVEEVKVQVLLVASWTAAVRSPVHDDSATQSDSEARAVVVGSWKLRPRPPAVPKKHQESGRYFFQVTRRRAGFTWMASKLRTSSTTGKPSASREASETPKWRR